MGNSKEYNACCGEGHGLATQAEELLAKRPFGGVG